MLAGIASKQEKRNYLITLILGHGSSSICLNRKSMKYLLASGKTFFSFAISAIFRVTAGLTGRMET